MSLKRILYSIFTWRIILLALALPAVFTSTLNLFSVWSNFEGLRYLDLAKNGYGFQHLSLADYALLPAYPWLIKVFSMGGNYLASGLFVSHLALILAFFYLYRLVALDFKTKIAKSTLFLLLIFPTSFFFGSVYPESIFLLFAVLCFYFARKNSFWQAGIFALLAAMTHIAGIFLWPALIYEYFLTHKKSVSPALLLPPLGILAFIRFQFLTLGFRNFWPVFLNMLIGKNVEKLLLIHQVFFRYARMLIFTDHSSALFFTVLLEFICASLILLVILFSLKKIRFSYWLFISLSYLLPSFSGTFSSLPRLTLVLFPVFIYLASWLDRQHPFVKYLYYFLSVVFSVIAVSLFTRGYFIG